MLKDRKRIALSSGLGAEVERILFGTGLFVSILTALWACLYVPMNMDEALNYHQLACSTHPFSSWHIFTFGCNHPYDLRDPLGFVFSRPYPYTGVTESVLYAPFFYLFHSPYAQYLLGVGFLVGFAFLAARETAKPKLTFAMVLAFFPLVFDFIHDEGPVRLPFVLYFLFALATRRLLAAERPATFFYAVLLALMAFVGVEQKIFFLIQLPAIALFVAALLWRGDGSAFFNSIARVKVELGVAVVLAAAMVSWLLFSVNTEFGTYLSWIPKMDVPHFDSNEMADNLSILSLSWVAFTHRYFVLWMKVVFFLGLASLLWIGFCAGVSVKYKKFLAPIKGRLFLLISCSLVFFALLMLSKTAWTGHHLIFVLFPLLFAFCDVAALLPPKPLLALGLGFMFLNAGSLFAATQFQTVPNISREREAIMAYFDREPLASQSIVNYSMWGNYFIHSLYAPTNLLVTEVEPLTRKQGLKLLSVAEQTHREIYNVCFSEKCRPQKLEEATEGLFRFEDVMPGLRMWHLYKVSVK
jgi:hypothetical protein